MTFEELEKGNELRDKIQKIDNAIESNKVERIMGLRSIYPLFDEQVLDQVKETEKLFYNEILYLLNTRKDELLQQIEKL